jgi:hypothetical protein
MNDDLPQGMRLLLIRSFSYRIGKKILFAIFAAWRFIFEFQQINGKVYEL